MSDTLRTKGDLGSLEPPPGEWLFKLRGEVLGPLPSQELIERMFSGEVDESTLISRGEGDWVALQTVQEFLPFLARAKAKIRADQARAEVERAARRRRSRARVNISIGAVALVVVGFAITYLFIVYRPSHSADGLKVWAQRHVPLVGIPVAEAAVLRDRPAEREPERKIDIDQILIDDAPALVSLRAQSPGVRRPPTPGSSPGRPASDSGKRETVSSVSTLSQEEILGEVFAPANKRRLITCLQDEIRRKTDLPTTVIVGFTINNDGRVGEVRMDDFRLENSSLHHCFKEKLSALRYRAYAGERRNIEIPFNIGR